MSSTYAQTKYNQSIVNPNIYKSHVILYEVKYKKYIIPGGQNFPQVIVRLFNLLF